MTTYKELLLSAQKILKTNGIADAELDAWYLLAHVFGINRADFFMDGHKEGSKDKALEYKELIERRASNIPLQYLTGTQEFMGLEFEVDENVLIPRQDTEILVEEVLKVSKDKSVLDLCTGSGCIILSLAKLGNLKKAIGSDISTKALEVARRNADYLNIPAHKFSEEHLFYKDEGYNGFSDFTVLPGVFIDGGSTPRAVVVHLSYINENQENILKFILII